MWTSDENDEMMKPQEEKKQIYVDQLLIPVDSIFDSKLLQKKQCNPKIKTVIKGNLKKRGNLKIFPIHLYGMLLIFFKCTSLK